jgi:hypothetical protein
MLRKHQSMKGALAIVVYRKITVEASRNTLIDEVSAERRKEVWKISEKAERFIL